MTVFTSGAYNAEEANTFIGELRDFLSTLPDLQIKDLQLIGMRSENICLKLPMLEQYLRIKNNCYRCLKQDRDETKVIENKRKGLKDDMASTMRSYEKIKDIDFIQKCLNQIESLEQANNKLKRSLKIQDTGKESRYEAAKMHKGAEYFTMER